MKNKYFIRYSYYYRANDGLNVWITKEETIIVDIPNDELDIKSIKRKIDMENFKNSPLNTIDYIYVFCKEILLINRIT